MLLRVEVGDCAVFASRVGGIVLWLQLHHHGPRGGLIDLCYRGEGNGNGPVRLKRWSTCNQRAQ